MSDIVIKAENLGKKYIIGHHLQNGRSRYTALRDVLAQNARSVWHKTRDLLQGKPLIHGDSFEEVWALKDVSFEVKRGEVIGIIGRNGAGKSTLLKILSRITEPSTGRVAIKGRVASLLEVGTGFHPELTGRENIFLNGAILGMSRAEIKKKFDEIVAFAEVEKFIDTPVKRYSSGMYVRLAFAVAAHLEPEILVVDEVLAVGDAEFQKKCLGKMQDIADKQGRTILFVSHNMAAIESLTSRALLLNLGQLTHEGKVSDAVDNYLNQIAYSTRPSLSMWRQHSGTGEATIQDVIFMDAEGQAVDSFRPGSQIRIAFIVRVNTRLIFDVAFVIETAGSFPLFASHMSDSLHVEHRDGLFHFNVSISPNFLRHGCYYISFGLYSMDFKTRYDEYLHYPAFTIDGYSESVISDKRWGPLFFPFRWEVVCPKDHSTKNFPKNKGIACLK